MTAPVEKRLKTNTGQAVAAPPAAPPPAPAPIQVAPVPVIGLAVPAASVPAPAPSASVSVPSASGTAVKGRNLIPREGPEHDNSIPPAGVPLAAPIVMVSAPPLAPAASSSGPAVPPRQWKGKPADTRDALLKEVWDRIGTWRKEQTDRRGIENDIYDLATRGTTRQKGVKPPPLPEGKEDAYKTELMQVARKTAATIHTEDEPWAFFDVKGRRQPHPTRRIAVHVAPDAIVSATKFIINKVLVPFECVKEFKVSFSLRSAKERLDTFEIYFEDDKDRSNTKKLVQALEGLGNRVEGHPAMLATEGPGIGAGDEPPKKGVSFSELRSLAIAEVVGDHLKSALVDFDHFRRRVAHAFKDSGVDFENPSQNIARR